MIVQSAGDALLLITQADHARLAGAIMQHSSALHEHPRRSSVLLAIAEHDNGWTEADAVPQNDPATGIPLDFISAPTAIRQGVWPRGVARLAHDPWAAALVAQHAIAIFERYRSDPSWTRFFDEMEAMRGRMLDASGLSLLGLLSDYRFVALGDIISLTFCNGWTDVQQFDEWSVRLSGSRVVVSPSPFAGTTIPIAIDARELPQRSFHTNADLGHAFAAAPITRVRGVVVGSPT